MGNALVGVISLVVCVTPFIWMRVNRNKLEKEQLKLLEEMATAQGCCIKEHTTFGNCSIAIDTTKPAVFFIRKTPIAVQRLWVNLADVKTCHINTISRTIGSGMEKTTVIDKVALVFVPKDKKQSEVKMDLFDEDYDMRLGDQLPQSKVWLARINECLSNMH